MLFLNLLLFGSTFAMANLDVGKGVNIFGRYGFLGATMKVIGRQESWIFREPTVDIFEKLENEVANQPDMDETILNGDFHMEFCDDVLQLLAAYFREFKIEHMQQPWKAFTASWSDAAIANYFGINITHITKTHGYVLIRLSSFKESNKLSSEAASTLKPLQYIMESANQIEDGNVLSVGNFVKKFGSHYISSYITGDSLYQVLVYNPSVYYRLKKKLRKTGINSLSKSEVHAWFSPWYAEMGSILSASGNSTIVDWAKSVLKCRTSITPYSSLIRLYRNEKLLKDIDKKLKNSALLSLELKTLTPIFRDVVKKNWFIEIISNIIELWEHNMWLLF